MQVKPYTIYEASDGKRVIVVDFHRSKRLRFYDGSDVIKFKRVAGQMFATVSEAVKVYKLPSERDFHNAYMHHTRIAMYDASEQAKRSECYNGTLPVLINTDVIVDNMLEYIETI